MNKNIFKLRICRRSKIFKYLRIFFIFFKQSLSRDMAYRLDFVSNVISSIGWQFFTLFSSVIIGETAGEIGGWTTYELLVIASTWVFVNGVAFFFFYRNIKQFGTDVFTGHLDYSLTKPIDLQFLVSTRRVIINALFSTFVGFITLIFAVNRLDFSPQWWRWAIYFALIPFGVLIYYSFWFLSAVMSIFWEDVGNLAFVVWEVLSFSKFPPQAFPQIVAKIFSTVVPVLVMTIPASQILLGKADVKVMLPTVVLSILLFWGVRRFFYWALRYYSGASV